MDTSRKYFGMTVAQISIIAGMVVVLCLIVCVGGWFMLRNSLRGLAPVSSLQTTPTTEPTVTPYVVMSPTAGITPTLMPIPYEQLIQPDWKQFKTPLVEIWLPDNFKLADKKTKDTTAPFSSPELFITEIPSKSSAYNMLVSVSYELMTGDSLDTFVRDQFPTFPYQAHVSDYQTVPVNSVEAQRILIEMRVNNIDVNDLVYVFQDGNTVWYVQYMAQITKFFDNLPIFEQSIKTFRPAKY